MATEESRPLGRAKCTLSSSVMRRSLSHTVVMARVKQVTICQQGGRLRGLFPWHEGLLTRVEVAEVVMNEHPHSKHEIRRKSPARKQEKRADRGPFSPWDFEIPSDFEFRISCF
jgi:hypothetical protein